MARWAASAAFLASWTSLSSAFNCGSTAAAAPRSAFLASVSGSARNCVNVFWRRRWSQSGRRRGYQQQLSHGMHRLGCEAVLGGFGPRKFHSAANGRQPNGNQRARAVERPVAVVWDRKIKIFVVSSSALRS